eukprot:2517605-Rhodomonas_salina.1
MPFSFNSHPLALIFDAKLETFQYKSTAKSTQARVRCYTLIRDSKNMAENAVRTYSTDVVYGATRRRY